MVDPYEFRARLSPGTDFSMLNQAVQLSTPGTEIEPADRVLWVADSIDGITNGLQAASLQTSFGRVYGTLSRQIAVDFTDFNHPHDLANTAVTFFEEYRRPVAGVAYFLQGNDPALSDVLTPWVQTLMIEEDQQVEDIVKFVAGMLAHIITDLKPSLDASNPSLNYRSDYTDKVGEKIEITTRSLAPDLLPGHPLLRKALIPVILWGIAYIRETAYINHQAQKLATPEQKALLAQRLEREATRANAWLLRLGNTGVRAARVTERIPHHLPWSRKRST